MEIIKCEKFNFINEKTSDYKLNVYKDSKVLQFATKEMQEMLSLVSGYTLPLLQEGEVATKTISLITKEEYVKLFSNVNFKQLKSSGYAITVDENANVYITANTDHAILYGVYSFMNLVAGVEIYANNEIKTVKQDNLYIDFSSVVDVPDIEVRHLGFYDSYQSEVASNRLRVIHDNMSFLKDGSADEYYEGEIVKKIWGGLWAHTMMSVILPPEKDENGEVVHKDWYNEAVTQMCFTNVECRKAFVARLKECILAQPDGMYYMLGISDNTDYCQCEECKKADKKYGGPSGTYIKFIRDVACEIEEWQKEVLPEKEFLLCAFAYNEIKNAPVTLNEKTGEFEPNSQDLILPKNTAIMVAPLDACGYHDLDAPCNQMVKNRFKGWGKLCDKLIVWDYHVYFDNYFILLPTFNTYKRNVEVYKEYNAKYVYCEGSLYGKTSCFQSLKVYLLSKLLWDCSLDDKALIKDFMANYYKGASKFVEEYYFLMEEHFENLEKHYDKMGGKGFHTAFDVVWQPDVFKDYYFPLELLNKAKEILTKGIESCNGDLELEKRVKTELASIEFLLIEMYSQYKTKEEFKASFKNFKELVKDSDLVRFRHGHKNPERFSLDRKYIDWICFWPARNK